MFSPSCRFSRLSFHFICISFAVQKVLSLIRSHLLIFVFISITLGERSNKILWQFMSKSILLVFSFRSFIVSGLTFQSSIHFYFIFVYGVKEVLISFFYMQRSSFPSTTYQRDCVFYTEYSCLLCHRLINHMCMGLFLGVLSCPFICISVFGPVPHCSGAL